MKLIKKLTIGLALVGSMLFTQNVNAQSITNTVTVAWDAVSTYTDGSVIDVVATPVKYNVYRATQPNLSDLDKLNVATGGVTALSFADSTLVLNVTYYYVVRAYVISGLESDNSTVVSVKTLKPGKVIIRVSIN